MITLVNQIAEGWWGWMGSMLWQVSLLILIVGVVDLLIGKWAWPPVRYALWLLVLLKLVIPPTWSLGTSVVSRSMPWVQERIIETWAGDAEGLAGQPPAGSRGKPAVPGSPGMEPSSTGAQKEAQPAGLRVRQGLVWQAYAMAGWLLGMVLFSVGLALRIGKLRRWHREQETRGSIPPWFHELMVQTARRLNLDRLPAIVFSEDAVTPAVYGVFRPVLLLPANYADSLSPEEAEHVLLHELAHLKRGDLWMHGVCLVLQIVYWFNPLLVWVRKQLRHVREMCCDLTIANVLREKTRAYRETLLNTARELLTESLEPGMGLLGVFEEPFRLVARLRWLEKDTWRNRRAMGVAASLVVLFMVPCVLPMAAPEAAPPGGVRTAARNASTPENIPGPPQGDYYIRDEVRTSTYFLGFRTSSKLVEINELWVGDGRVSLTQGNRTMILDAQKNTFTFVNPTTRTYVEASFPLDMDALLPEKLARHRRELVSSGSVEETGKTRTIMGHETERYDVLLWWERDGQRENFREGVVWATTDVPFDVSLFEELLDAMRVVYNKDDKSREELRKIRGIQLGFKAGGDGFFFNQGYSSNTVEIARKMPPPGTYEPPSGYTRNDRFTPDDF
jgi:beta-lactamase regulating signal transducer with metallopeptidase domain